MRVEDFYDEVRNRVALRASLENDYTSASFMAEVAEELEDVGEADHLSLLHFEGTGSRNRKLRVDGYDLSDTDGSVALASLVFTGTPTLCGISAADVRRAFTQLENFLRDSMAGIFERDREESSPAFMLARSLRERGRSITRFRLYLITDARLSERAASINSSEVDGIRVEYHLWDMTRLHQVQESRRGREELDIDLDEWASGGLPALKIASGDLFDTFLAAVPGRMVAELYERYGSRLLESNVRSYLSARGKVNKGIRITLASQPEMFLAYNNGITATATGVKIGQDLGSQCTLMTIRDLQIVNGGQTTASLFYIRRENKGVDLSNVFVQMKLVVVDPDHAVDMVPNISRFANSQNRVSEVDFFSNSPYHVRLEELSRRVLVPAQSGVNYQTKWFYERTRGQYANEKTKLSKPESRKFEATFPRNRVITKTDAAKYEVSFAGRPHTVSGGAQKNFVAFAETVGKRWEEAPADFNELYYKELVAKAIIYNSFRSLISCAPWYDKGYLANIVAYTIAKMVHEVDVQGAGRELDLVSVWNMQEISPSMGRAALTLGERALALLTDPSRSVQNVTEWAKKVECWEQFKRLEVALDPEFLSTLVKRSAQAAAKKSARAVQKLDDGINAQIVAVKIPASAWRRAEAFGTARALLSPKELGILNVVLSGNVPTEKQSIVLLGLLHRLRESGFDDQ